MQFGVDGAEYGVLLVGNGVAVALVGLACRFDGGGIEFGRRGVIEADFQQETQGEDVIDFEQRERGNDGATARLNADQPFAFELQQCLAHRDTAHAVFFGECVLAQVAVRFVVATQDVFTDAIYQLLGKRYGFHGSSLWVRAAMIRGAIFLSMILDAYIVYNIRLKPLR